jgi:hypothetical protein
MIEITKQIYDNYSIEFEVSLTEKMEINNEQNNALYV